MISPYVLVLVFVISALAGYKVIKNIPSLLHTPLMSGMNALSGITAIGAILVVYVIMQKEETTPATYVAFAVGGLGLILAIVNVVGGFGVTDRMLRMFNKKKGGK